MWLLILVSYADSDAKIETVDLDPNAAAFKRCHFGSPERAQLALETADDGSQRYRIEPPSKIVSIDCSSGCVPRGGRCCSPMERCGATWLM